MSKHNDKNSSSEKCNKSSSRVEFAENYNLNTKDCDNSTKTKDCGNTNCK